MSRATGNSGWTKTKDERIEVSKELSNGIAAYKRTWCRFDGLVVTAQCGSDPAVRKRGVFSAGECQPTITGEGGKHFIVRDLGSLRVEQEQES